MSFYYPNKFYHNFNIRIRILAATICCMLAFLSTAEVNANPRPDVPSAFNAAGFTLTFTLSDYNGFAVSCNGATDASVDMEITGGA